MKTTSARSKHGDRTRRARAAAAVLVALAAMAGACRRSDDGLRGQSGSEGPAGTGGSDGTQDQNLPCPCAVDAIVLRLTVLDSRGPERRVRVEEVIHGVTDRAAGDELDVEDAGELPCFFGSSPVADGQQALAIFTPADPSSCDAADCGLDGSVRLTPWADTLLFAATAAGNVSVPADELASLWSDDVDRCIERHGDVWRLLESAAPADEP
jgi:hypothetical protein